MVCVYVCVCEYERTWREREREKCVCVSGSKRRGLLSFDLFLVESSPVTKEDLILGLSDRSRRLQSSEFKKNCIS